MPDASKISTELFRFITIRDPQPAQAAPQKAIQYTWGADPINSYLGTLGGLRVEDESDEEIIADMVAAANTYLASGSGVKTLAGWESTQPLFKTIVDTFYNTPEVSRSHDFITTLCGEIAIMDPVALSALMDVAWNNLMSYNIAGGDRRCVEFAMNMIRVQSLLANLGSIPDPVSNRDFEAMILLPEYIFPLPKPESVPDDGDPSIPDDPNAMSEADVELVNDTLIIIKDVRDAIDDIVANYETVTEEALVLKTNIFTLEFDDEGNVITPDPLPVMEPLGILDATFKARLTADTQGILTARNFSNNVRISFAVTQLEKEVNKLNLLVQEKIKMSTTVVQVGGAFFQKQLITINSGGGIEDPPPVVKEIGGGLSVDDPWIGCKIKPLGIGDYRRVEQTLTCYKPGEIAHIENVLKGEGKERSTRHLNRIETQTILTTETQRETETDTTTTDRYQMEKETSKVLQQDISLQIGVQTQGDYGAVQVQASTGFAYANSKSESDSAAVSYGKDVTSRALKRVIERTSETRITTTINEFEEINKHTVDNVDGDGHVVGIYRWVDKVYKNEVVNYGKRLMFQFMVPDPAAFHRYAMENPIAGTVTIDKPIDPILDIQIIKNRFSNQTLTPLRSIEDINQTNYMFWAGLYSAKVTAPPPTYKIIGISKSQDGMPNDGPNQTSFSYNDLVVPEGYKANAGFISLIKGGSSSPFDVEWVTVNVGTGGISSGHLGPLSGSFSLSEEVGVVPVSMSGRINTVAMNIEITCGVTAQALADWKLKTFSTVMDAYNAKLAEYNNALSEAKANAGFGSIQLQGTNPGINRKLEKMELQKHCLRMLSSCTFSPSQAMRHPYNVYELPNPIKEYPDLDCCSAIADGNIVQFLENCFQWDLMTYIFYPYFYSNKARWKMIYQLNDADPMFLDFLKSGYARVVVPVRPGFEAAAMRYSADGTIWGGGPVPALNDKYYVSIVQEMAAELGDVEGEPWFTRVPTDLTILQNDASGLDASGLPCDAEGIGS